MAVSVDEKVVQLTLDNKQFNQGSVDTIDSINKLKKALMFEGAIDSFDKVEKQINSVSFNPLTKGIETVSKSWTMLDSVVDATLRNMTNRIIDTGERMLKSLTTDQITQGWDQYAERTGAVQTIMAATASQFEDTNVQMQAVNNQLSKLTWFTDETSHKFNDMVSGIGKFTANNVGLETSVKAMEGIATWASISGANTNEAARAIYNLAQAVSVGAVKLIDWRSIENANMGTTEFKKTVIETAEALGTLTKVSEGLWKVTGSKDKEVSLANFSEHLSEGWFSSDVLLKSLEAYGGFADELNKFVEETGMLTATALNYIDEYIEGTLDIEKVSKSLAMDVEDLTEWLEKLGDNEFDLGRRAFKAAQETKTFAEAIDYVKTAVSSGWATSFEYIFGDYLEAKKWWSEIAEVMYDAFVVGGEIRNEVLEMWSEFGGRDDFLDGIRAGIENIMEILDIFKSTWREVWYGAESEQIRNQAYALASITKRFREFMEALKPTEQTTENLHNLLKALFGVLKTGVDILKSLSKVLEPIGALMNVLAGSFLQILADVAQLVNLQLQNIFTPERLEKIANAMTVIGHLLSGLIQIGLLGIFEIIDKLINAIGTLWTRFKEVNSIQDIFNVLISTVKDFFGAFMDGETFVNKVVDIILIAFATLVDGIKKIINVIIGLFTGEITFGDVFTGIQTSFDGFDNYLDKLQIEDKLQNIIIWVKNFGKELFGSEGIIVESLRNITDVMKYFWENLQGLFSQLTVDDVKDFMLIIILWQFIGGINGLTKAFRTTVSSFGQTLSTFNNFLKTLTGQNASIDKLTAMFKAAKFLQIGLSVAIIVGALDQLNKLDYVKTQQSVAALGTTLGILLAALSVLPKILEKFPKKDADSGDNKSLERLSKSLMFISVGALMISQALKTLNDVLYDDAGKFDFKKTIIDFIAIGEIITVLTAATAALNYLDTGKISTSGLTIIALAAGLRLVIASVKAISNLNPNTAVEAANSVSKIILAMGASVGVMSFVNWKTALSLVPLITSVAISMVAMTGAVAILALLVDDGRLVAALTAFITELVSMGVAISLLGTFLKQTPARTITSIGLSMIEFSVAFTILTGAMKNIESYNWSESKEAVIALGVGFGVMSAALGILGNVLKTVNPATITSIGISFDLLSAAVFILAESLNVVSGLNWKDLEIGVGLIAAFLGGFTIISAVVAGFDVAYAGLISKAFSAIGVAMLEFSAAVAIMSVGLLALSAIGGVVAASIITITTSFQKLADTLGVDIATAVSTTFNTLKVIISEFLKMLRDLAPDFLLTFTALFGTIWLAIEAVKHPTATAIVALMLEIASVIIRHQDEVLDALVAVIKFVTNAEPLYDALEDLWGRISTFLGTIAIRSICGVASGIVNGFVTCLGNWLGFNQDKVTESFNDTMANAVSQMYDEEVDAKTKEVAYETISGLIEGWKNGEVDLTGAMAESGIAAMEYYKQIMGDAAYDAGDEIADQIDKGVEDNKGKVKNSGKKLGEAQLDGYIEAQDPAEPMDKYYELTTYIKDQVSKGMASIAGDLYNTGASGGNSVLDGFKTVLLNGLNSIGINGNKLVEGFSTSSGKYDHLKKTDAQYANAKRKSGEILGKEIADVVEDASKEAEPDVAKIAADIGENYISNLAKGATSSTSKSKLASASKSAAETIADSFADEIDRINRESNIQDKLYKLWTAQNPYATEIQKAAKEIETQTDKVQQKMKLAEIAEKTYQQTLEAMGESAKETQEAYVNMLDLQIEVLELQNQLTEKYNEYMKKQNKTDIYDYFDKNAAKNAYNANEQFLEAWKKWAPFADYFYDTFGYGESFLQRALMKDLGMLDDAIQQGDEYLDDVRMKMYEIVELGIGAEDILKRYGRLYDYFDKSAAQTADRERKEFISAWEKWEPFVDYIHDTFGYDYSLIKRALMKDLGQLNDYIRDGDQYLDDIRMKMYDLVDRGMGVRDVFESYGNINDAVLESFDFSEYYYRGQQSGQNMADGLVDGLNGGLSSINSAAYNLGDSTWDSFNKSLGIHSPSTSFMESGRMIGYGIIKGMEETKTKVTEVAIDVAMSAYDAACKKLGIHSPSTKMMEVGQYFDLGLSNGIDEYSTIVQRSVGGMISNMVDKSKRDIYKNRDDIQNRIQKIFDVGDELSMRIVIDADVDPATRAISELEHMQYMMTGSSVYSGSNYMQNTLLNDIFDQGLYRAVQLQRLYDLIESYVQNPRILTQASSSESMDQPTIVNFTQNNTSPKEISRVDIYRDTQRQLNTFVTKFGITKRY